MTRFDDEKKKSCHSSEPNAHFLKVQSVKFGLFDIYIGESLVYCP